MTLNYSEAQVAQIIADLRDLATVLESGITTPPQEQDTQYENGYAIAEGHSGIDDGIIMLLVDGSAEWQMSAEKKKELRQYAFIQTHDKNLAGFRFHFVLDRNQTVRLQTEFDQSVKNYIKPNSFYLVHNVNVGGKESWHFASEIENEAHAQKLSRKLAQYFKIYEAHVNEGNIIPQKSSGMLVLKKAVK